MVRWTNAAGEVASDGGGEGVRMMEWVMVMVGDGVYMHSMVCFDNSNLPCMRHS